MREKACLYRTESYSKNTNKYNNFPKTKKI